MKISIIHPSRQRPQQAMATAKAWLSSAKDRQDIEYILSIDVTDTHENKMAYHNISADVLLCYDNNSAITAINRAAAVSKGDLLIVVSDDFNQPPFHWDDALRIMLRGKSDYIVKTADGIQPWIITLPVMDRVYYQRFGYIYYPEYGHMFCDTEMTHVADLLDKKITLPIKFAHNHYTTGNTAKDAVNIKNDRTWSHGEALYLERMMSHFGLPEDDIKGVLRCDENHYNWLRSKGILLQRA